MTKTEKVLMVSYFKRSGKWYMDEEIIVPDKFINDMSRELECAPVTLDKTVTITYDFRVWLAEYLSDSYVEFHAVVSCDSNHEPVIEQLLGYPYMRPAR